MKDEAFKFATVFDIVLLKPYEDMYLVRLHRSDVGKISQAAYKC